MEESIESTSNDDSSFLVINIKHVRGLEITEN